MNWELANYMKVVNELIEEREWRHPHVKMTAEDLGSSEHPYAFWLGEKGSEAQ